MTGYTSRQSHSTPGQVHGWYRSSHASRKPATEERHAEPPAPTGHPPLRSAARSASSAGRERGVAGGRAAGGGVAQEQAALALDARGVREGVQGGRQGGEAALLGEVLGVARVPQDHGAQEAQRLLRHALAGRPRRPGRAPAGREGGEGGLDAALGHERLLGVVRPAELPQQAEGRPRERGGGRGPPGPGPREQVQAGAHRARVGEGPADLVVHGQAPGGVAQRPGARRVPPGRLQPRQEGRRRAVLVELARLGEGPAEGGLAGLGRGPVVVRREDRLQEAADGAHDSRGGRPRSGGARRPSGGTGRWR